MLKFEPAPGKLGQFQYIGSESSDVWVNRGRLDKLAHLDFVGHFFNSNVPRVQSSLSRIELFYLFTSTLPSHNVRKEMRKNGCFKKYSQRTIIEHPRRIIIVNPGKHYRITPKLTLIKQIKERHARFTPCWLVLSRTNASPCHLKCISLLKYIQRGEYEVERQANVLSIMTSTETQISGNEIT